MDEKNYQSLRKDIFPLMCVFEKSILSSRLCCSHAAKNNIADREVVQCASKGCRPYCVSWLGMLRKKSQFALRLTDTMNPAIVLPHGKEMKIQVGGINGVATYLKQQQQNFTSKIELDVSVMLELCRTISNDYEQLPFDKIIQSITHYRVR